RQPFGLLAKVVLLARQTFELAPELLLFHLLAAALQVLALAVERFLAARELANPLERVLTALWLLALFGGVRRLVVGLLQPAKLPVEQVRQVGFRTILPAASASLLRPGHL